MISLDSLGMSAPTRLTYSLISARTIVRNAGESCYPQGWMADDGITNGLDWLDIVRYTR